MLSAARLTIYIYIAFNENGCSKPSSWQHDFSHWKLLRDGLTVHYKINAITK